MELKNYPSCSGCEALGSKLQNRECLLGFKNCATHPVGDRSPLMIPSEACYKPLSHDELVLATDLIEDSELESSANE